MNEKLKDEDIRKYLFSIGIRETSAAESMKIVKKLTAPIVDYLNKHDNIPHGIFISQMIVHTIENSFMDQLVKTFKKVNKKDKDSNEKGSN